MLALTVMTVGLAALLLSPPASDLVQLLIFLPVSGVGSLVAALVFSERYRGGLFHGIRGKLLLAAVLSAGLVLINVSFTAYLMFFSSHDLKLTAQRRRILDRAFATHEHFSADELYAWLKAEPGPHVSRAADVPRLACPAVSSFRPFSMRISGIPLALSPAVRSRRSCWTGWCAGHG